MTRHCILPLLLLLMTMTMAACSSDSGSPADDRDNDMVTNDMDICPDVYNPAQIALIGANTSKGDVCDDEDGDGIVDSLDNCPFIANADQLDSNGNGMGDVCELCKPASLVNDIVPFSGSSDPRELTALGGRLYFTAYDASHGREIRVFDPVVSTLDVIDLVPGNTGSNAGGLIPVNGKLYFQADNGVDGYQLWAYDPFVADPVPTALGISSIEDPFALNDLLFFRRTDPVFGSELFVYDLANTPDSAAMVADIAPGDRSSLPREFFALNGKLYFSAYTAVSGRELWVYDPATPEAGVNQLPQIAEAERDSDPRELTALNNLVYLSAGEPVHGVELYVFDPANPSGDFALVDDIYPGSANGIPGNLSVLDGKLYFSARDEAHGRELWGFDPLDTSLTGASLVEDIRVGEEHSSIGGLTVLDGKLYFSANDGIAGQELWVYDPGNSTNPISMVADVNNVPGMYPPAAGNSSPSHLTALDGKLYFSAYEPASGKELWVHDASCTP